MRVLVACEFSGVVREAFRAQGHDAWSCDLLPTEQPGPHIQGDVLDLLCGDWDLMIAHPPCTHLASSGAVWFPAKRANGRQQEAVGFFMNLVNAPIPKIVIENPVGIMSTQYRKPDQIIQPWQFGHGETKATCLWLKGLPILHPTNVVTGRTPRVHMLPPGPDRWKERSRTYRGIAEAMAEQWGHSLAASPTLAEARRGHEESKMRNLGWENGWEHTPAIVRACKDKGHRPTEIEHDQTRHGLDTEYRCDICGYLYHVDSSD